MNQNYIHHFKLYESFVSHLLWIIREDSNETRIEEVLKALYSFQTHISIIFIVEKVELTDKLYEFFYAFDNIDYPGHIVDRIKKGEYDHLIQESSSTDDDNSTQH
ncbi:MAG: hypothetical protein TR69_WS6001001064 [candidate division WS6 bacterium OLB20]|uniref:Uncharacterized protein n=1 Tax=candidate division WS6 bacterium OLB20 TaxID=1617426 RepID=A0A136LZG3_9BACT|nr:MAG: hypothetical protein TR69_WS6001001064 [candidate division WS6 bacterium OLB20]